MELNLVPLIEAAKGITWQGAMVILACLFATCYLARIRLIHGREERQFWREAAPEQIQARAATTATLPRPVRAPPSPLGPALILLIFLGCALLPPPYPTVSILKGRQYRAMGDFPSDPRAPGFPVYEVNDVQKLQ